MLLLHEPLITPWGQIKYFWIGIISFFYFLLFSFLICNFAATSCAAASPRGTPLVWSQEHFDCSIAALAAARWPLLIRNDKSKRRGEALVIPYTSAGPGAALFFFFRLCLTRLQPQGPGRQQLLWHSQRTHPFPLFNRFPCFLILITYCLMVVEATFFSGAEYFPRP